MRLSLFAFLSVCTAATVLTACGQNGFLGTAPSPDGNIVIAPAAGGTPIVTTASNPYPMTVAQFALSVTEKHFNGTFQTQFTSVVAEPPCYQVSLSPTVPNVYVFQAFPGVTAPVAGATPLPVIEPCTSGDGGVLNFNDGHGHTAPFYYYQAVPIYAD